nr:MAG TPA: hypothetical protein [Bacteriophage sp.]
MHLRGLPLSVPLPKLPSMLSLPPQFHIGHVILSMIFFTF